MTRAAWDAMREGRNWSRDQFRGACGEPGDKNWWRHQFLSLGLAAIPLLPVPIRAQTAPVLQLSSTTAQLGVPVAATVTSALEPDLEASTTDTYAVALAGEPKPDPKAGAGAKDWPLQIVPLAVGSVPVKVEWKQAGAPPASAVLSVLEPDLPKDADVADIKKPARARPALWPWLLALALAALGWWVWKKRPFEGMREEEPGGPPPDDRPADVIALEKLAALEASGLWASGRHKDFYGGLTDVVRDYLERRFAMPALKLTTWELARQLREAELDRAAVQLFKGVFDRADLVKFAKITPEPGQGPLDLDAARQLVKLTAPPREQAPAQEARP